MTMSTNDDLKQAAKLVKEGDSEALVEFAQRGNQQRAQKAPANLTSDEQMDLAHIRDQRQIRHAQALKQDLKAYVMDFHSGNGSLQRDAFNVIAQLDADIERKMNTWN